MDNSQWSLNDWLAYQEHLHPRAIELGLGRVSVVLDRLGWQPPPFKVVTVAGTNGKGSCVALLEAIFMNAGYHTVSYTSPHLLHYNERVRLNGHDASDEELCAAFVRVEAARGDISLTYFEYGTLAALDLFGRARPEVAIIEVGLGGRLDATNIIDADVAVVTTVDLDHREWLGPNRESVGREKAGIFRSSRPAICGDPQPPITLVEYARTIGATLYIQGRDFGWRYPSPQGVHGHQLSGGWDWWCTSHKLGTSDLLPAPRMFGLYQYQNAATALMAVACLSDHLPVPLAAIDRALREVAVPGRFQVIAGPPPCILDVAHNPQAATSLAATLRTMPVPAGSRTLAVAAMLADKDISATLGAMINVVDAWYLASLPSARGASAEHLAKILMDSGCLASIQVHADVARALLAARSCAATDDRIVVFGSFHTVSAVIHSLTNE